MNTELMEALTILEKEKNISRETMLEAIENSLVSACKNHFGTSDNIKVIMNKETCDYAVFAEKQVVEEVTDPVLEISLEDAEKIDSSLQIGDVAQVKVESKSFGRIATQNAKNLILQKIDTYNKAIRTAPPRLYDLYVSLYLENNTQESLSETLGLVSGNSTPDKSDNPNISAYFANLSKP